VTRTDPTRAASRRAAAAVAFIAALATACAASAESLGDAISLAYQSNPTLLAARADLRALDERYVQARAALGPTAGVSEQHSFDDSDVDQAASIFGPARTARQTATTDTAQLLVSQPLYAGGQLETAVNAAHAEVRAGRENLRQQEAVVLNTVITAYADVLLWQNLQTIARQNVELLNQQLAEAEAKFAVKENTLTDRAQARARLAAARNSFVQARAGFADAQARYLAAVGVAPGQLEPLPDLPGIPPSVDDAFDAAGRANPQILAAVYTEQASRARVAQAKASDGLRVSVSVALSQQPAAPYVRDQNVRGVVASVTVSKSLFTSGDHVSRVHEAIEVNNSDDQKLSAQQRQVVAAVAQAWGDLAARREQLTGLRDQLENEEQAFRGARIEERIGLRTTIDVLNAEQEFQSTKVALAQAFHDEYLNRVNLLAAMGLLQAELLQPDIQPYRPEQNLERRTLLSRAMPWESLVMALDSIGAPHLAANRLTGELTESQRPPGGSAMPPAPQWSDLAKYLIDPTGG